MAKTQTHIDIEAARKHAAELGLECQIEGDDDGMTITMGTGEVEKAAGLPRATSIIDAYASLGGGVSDVFEDDLRGQER